ncbi:hypothetical protein CYY_003966 [Polysphondylium violaceum]|uniref:N-acetyltransferase domain-containing protein n=1 Tax=Polysphondylium violaceum TaxID=133409 RepID=A0A8J4PXP4_9MYCE|nr:hypothetical protein CYY_003966 [Polysphondylium violaceum]
MIELSSASSNPEEKLYIYQDDEIYIKRMVDCPLSQVNQAWHEGFDDGYTKKFGVTYRFTIDQLIQRFTIETHSLEYSVVCYCKQTNRPIGFIASGVRTLKNGMVMSWNGGTAIIPEYRRKGIGKKLMRAQEQMYVEAKVDIASIEVVLQNESALNLYKEMGFADYGLFVNMNQSGAISKDLFNLAGPLKLRPRPCTPQEVGALDWYPSYVPWQTQWQSHVFGGDCIMIENQDTNEIVAYAVTKNRYDANGHVDFFSLRQTLLNPLLSLDDQQQDQILNTILFNVLKPDLTCPRNITHAPLFPALNEKIVDFAQKLGFKKFIDILCLKKSLTNKFDLGF